jgi:Ca2+/H+ antiporter, TMEM165/GDT1 family
MFKSWRTAILATVAALGVLTLLVVVFGFALGSYLPPNLARTAVGVFLLLFGLGWLYKAILRSTGMKALHDEAAAYEETREELMTHGHAFGTAFAGVFLEGLEVVFIVVALAGLNNLLGASVGAAASLVVVVVAGVVLRQPLTRVPENLVKYAVGVMLTAFGTFFAGEGIGINWWQSDLSLLPLIAVYALASLGLVVFLRRPRNFRISSWTPVRYARAAILEVWGLFVTDGLLAAVAVAAILFVAISIDRFNLKSVAGPLLVGGVLVAVTAALAQAAKRRGATKVPEPVHEVSQPVATGALASKSTQ